MSDADAALDQVRAICMSLDNVEERQSHGEAAWFHAKGKQFTTFWNRHHGLPLSFLCAAAPGVQEGLVGEHPDRFFRPPYVGVKGWVAVILEPEVPVDWEEAADLIAQAYALTHKKAKR